MSDSIFDQFDRTNTDPVSPGQYRAVVIDGRFGESRTGTPVFRVRFRIAGGPYEGVVVSRAFPLTAAAMAASKRQLKKMGIATSEHLRQGIDGARRRIVCTIRVSHKFLDGGSDAPFIDVVLLNVDSIETVTSPLDRFDAIRDEKEGSS